jgi:hypothetical protein
MPARSNPQACAVPSTLDRTTITCNPFAPGFATRVSLIGGVRPITLGRVAANSSVDRPHGRSISDPGGGRDLRVALNHEPDRCGAAVVAPNVAQAIASEVPLTDNLRGVATVATP